MKIGCLGEIRPLRQLVALRIFNQAEMYSAVVIVVSGQRRMEMDGKDGVEGMLEKDIADASMIILKTLVYSSGFEHRRQ